MNEDVRETWICCPECEVECRAIDDGDYLICPNCNAVLQRIKREAP